MNMVYNILGSYFFSIHDVYARHRDKSFIDLLTANYIRCVFVPANRTDDLQLHDVYFNKNFKQGVRTRFDDWVVERLVEESRKDSDNIKLDLGMNVVKPLIVKFSVDSLKEVPVEGARKAFDSIGFSECFNSDFQDRAELKREELRSADFRMIDAVVGEEETGEGEEEEDLLGDDLREDHLREDHLREDHLREDHLREDDLREDDLREDDMRDDISEVGDISEEENDVGRQVAVIFNNRADPGIVSQYNKKTGKYTVEFDDDTVYADIEFKELIFLD